MGSWVAPTAYLMGAGWFFATCIIAGIVLGRWADSATGLEPTFTLVGIVLGLAVAMAGGIRMLMPFMRRYGGGTSEKR
ncbi:MAG: AtpZ/AtpI family protein [Tepidiformaceae bacterium]